jgi:hypothetical protein
MCLIEKLIEVLEEDVLEEVVSWLIEYGFVKLYSP